MHVTWKAVHYFEINSFYFIINWISSQITIIIYEKVSISVILLQQMCFAAGLWSCIIWSFSWQVIYTMVSEMKDKDFMLSKF